MIFSYHLHGWFTAKHLLYFMIISIIASSSKNSIAIQISSKILQPIVFHRDAEYFTNTWAVRILGGYRKAEGVAKHLGYDLRRNISEGFPDIYLFINPKYPEKTKFADDFATKRLRVHPYISWVEQQIAEIREIRKLTIAETYSSTERTVPQWNDPNEALQCPVPENPKESLYPRFLNLNDEYSPKQFYIKDCRENSSGMPRDFNLAPVWVKHRLFGENIIVIVIDDGVETKHLDLAANYNPRFGLDVQDYDNTPDPIPMLWRKYSHGTRCAGIIGMKANNTICGVGIAPSVTLGAVRLLGPNPVTDYKIGTALLFRHVKAHIMSNSWGPKDDGKIMPYSGPLARTALKIGITKGREGKGLIYVFAAGNGKKRGDNCGCDPLISSIYSIAVATCSSTGKVTPFSERCSSIMVTTYPGNVATDSGGKNSTRKCVTDFGGTSASTPMVTGAIALALQANPRLCWRGVQHLLAWTSQKAPLQDNPDVWMKNGAGFHVSHDFGFGLLNINDLVEEAKRFHGVGPMNSCITRASLNKDGDAGEIFCIRMKYELITDGCEGTPSEVAYLEHVQLTVSLSFPRRGDLEISLESPSGTRAKLLERRPHDSDKNGVRFWSFDSILTWGESPKGKWTIMITGERQNYGAGFRSSAKKIWPSSKMRRENKRNTRKSICNLDDDQALESIHVGELNDLYLTFHGTSANQMPKHYKSARAYQD